MKKIILLPALLLLLAFMLLYTPVSAAVPCTVYLDGQAMEYPYISTIRGGTSYLPLRAAVDHYGGRLTWDADSRTARWTTEDLILIARDGNCYIEANGRTLYAAKGIFIADGRLMIPTRLLAQALGGDAQWESRSRTVQIHAGSRPIEHADSHYDGDALLWLARIISAESRGEPMEGQIAVGNVVLNRVADPDYPNTIYGVIFDRKYGVQFEPVLNGSIYAEPTESAVAAAKLCLEGVDLSRGSIYFYDPAKAESSWIGRNCTYVMTIGVHKFYI